MSELPITEKAPETKRSKGKPLPLDQIKIKMAEMEGQAYDAVARACGFYTEVTNVATGEVEVRVTTKDELEFMKASLEAQSGIRLARPTRPHRRTNRSPVITIGKTGNIVVGGRHTTIAGFPFGEGVEFKVHVESEPGRIVITAANSVSPEQLDFEDPDETELDDLDS
jgi:hypothetical protein